jgi:cyanophycin synthetase
MGIKAYLKKVKSRRGKKFIQTALRMGVGIEVLSGDFNVLKLSWRGVTKLLYNEKIHFNLNPGPNIAKNKEATKLLLRENGINAPAGIYAGSYSEALRLMTRKKISFPVVVKPIDASDGIGVMVGIENKKELSEAISKMRLSLKKSKKKSSGLFVIEDVKVGRDYRILILNNRVIACAERVPAHIIGNGKSKVKALIENFNKARPPKYLLKIDADILKTLRKNNLTLSSILAKKQYLQLRRNANISTGGKAVEKTGDISKRFIKIARKCVRALGLNYAGIDLITDDISSNDTRKPYCVIEVNGYPEYEPHEKPIISGRGTNVTEILVNEFMKRS